MKEMTRSEAAEFLLNHNNYIIITHRRPDGDTIGCAAALCGGLRKIGKKAAILENPQFTPKFRPYLEGLTTETVPEDACLVAVDIAAPGLFSFSAEGLEDRISLLIDHHGRNPMYAKCNLVDSSAAACGEIILDVLIEMKVPVDARIAQAVYVAVSTDTGCFRYSNVTAKTLRTAALCKDFGADTFAVNQVMFLTKTMARLKLDSYLTETTQFYGNGLVAVSLLTNEIREKLGVTEDDIDNISGFGRDIEGVEIGIMIRQEGTKGKISVRSSPNYDAAAICARLGGGGHRAAAGATVEGGIEAAKAAVLESVSRLGVKL